MQDMHATSELRFAFGTLLASASVKAYAHVQFGVYLDFSMLPCLRLDGTRTTTVNLARCNCMLAELYCRGGLEGDCLTTGRLIHAAQSAVRSFHSPHKASGYEVGRSLSCSGRRYRALCQRGPGARRSLAILFLSCIGRSAELSTRAIPWLRGASLAVLLPRGLMLCLHHCQSRPAALASRI
jgi:hypothetical protein